MKAKRATAIVERPRRSAPAAAAANPSVWESFREQVSLGNYIPCLRDGLTSVHLTTRHGEPYIMLAERGRKYLNLTEEDSFLTERMDGRRSVSDLVVEYFEKYGAFAFERVAGLVADLRLAGFLTDPPRDLFHDLQRALRPEADKPRRRRLEGDLFMLKLPFHGTDRAVTAMHDRVGWLFFTRPAVLLGVVIGILGLTAFIAELAHGRDPFAPIGTSHIGGIVALVIAYYAAIFVHESAHALTCKHFGRRVDKAGVMLFYFVPAFYVDVTDIWLEPWRRRIAVSWAGPYSGFIVAGLSAIAVWAFPHAGLATSVLFKLAVAGYILNAFNLLPLLKLDGYYILMDWLEIPQLRERALAFIKGPMWQLLMERQGFTRREAFYAIFGGLSALYSSLSIYLAILYWGRRLRPIVRPLWQTPGFLAKAFLGLVVAVIVIPLLIRISKKVWSYQRTVRRAPQAFRDVVQTIRLRDRLRLLDELGFLAALPMPTLERLARAAVAQEVPTGTLVTRQGQRGEEFFVLADGEASVLVRERGDDRVVGHLGAGDFFGERALLGEGIRQATVRADSALRMLVFPREVFWREIAGTVAWETRVRAALEERERLERVPLLANATSRQLDLLTVKLEVQGFEPHEVLVRQGEPGDSFYIVREGTVEVLVRTGRTERRVKTLKEGAHFGEIALLRDGLRVATVRAVTAGSVWRLGRQDFRELIGRYLELEAPVAALAQERAVEIGR